MKKLDHDNVDSWLHRNASQRKALRSMLNGLRSKELPEFDAKVNQENRITTKNRIMNKITHLFKKLGVLTIMLWIAGSLNVLAQTNDFVPGKVRVKIKPDKLELVVKDGNTASVNGVLKTGLNSFDKISERYSASKMRRVFPHAGKNEAKHIQHGLHLWYEIYVRSEADMQAVASEYGGNEYITTAEPIRIKSLNYSGVSEAKSPVEASSAMTTNDPYLQDQWHLSNDGSLEGSVAGADINAFPAWDITTGTSNVIVAIVDGGVDTDHEDLKNNMWINEAELNGEPGEDDDFNGYIDDIYGYNFADNQGEVTAQDHGTHVAGTVAATSNNGKGVAGVAGGSGNGDGIKMISAQVFGDESSGNFASAIVYGADAGAVISQNSWGYQSAGVYEQAVLDAIDYFIEEAGNYPGSPMKGGVVLFAAGNNGRDELHYPSYYDKTIAIASTGTDYTRAYYSNYGDWVDLSTTGGSLRKGNKSQVLSTLPDNRYGYMQGTSMATPHASGIAALVVSKYGSETFTNEDLKKRLFSGVRDIESYNPDYIGKMGVGFMDALLALAPDDETAPDAISDLNLLGTSEDFATLNFTVPADAGDSTPYQYILKWSKESSMENASEEIIMNDFRSVGDLIEATVEGLDFETTYYFTVEAEDRWGNTSVASNIVEATTNQGPDIATNKSNLNISIDAQLDLMALDTIKVLNNDVGILNWDAETREVSNFASYTRAELPARGTVKSLSQLNVKQQGVEKIKQFAVQDAAPDAWESSTKSYYYSNPLYVIGEVDTTMTNSSATKFVVDEAEGFNLTYIRSYLNLDQEDGPAILEIYNGEEINEDNLIYSDDNFVGRKENDSRYHGYNLDEQLYFEQGETFWIVFHIPAGNLYPLGIGPETSPELSENCLMSFDLGETWVPIAGALNDDRYVWVVDATSNVEPLHQYMTLTPNEGQIAGIGEQDMEVSIDASQLINGTYRSNVVINSNDSDTPIYRVPAQVNVTGQEPVLATNNILEFGTVFNGTSETREMTIINSGFGRFRTQSIVSSNPNFKINTSTWSLNIPAKSDATIALTYTPSGVGNENAVITMTSYNGDVHKFSVFGVGTEPTEIEVNPMTINFDDVQVGENAQANLTISNVGEYPLQYGFPAFTDDVSHIENLPENVQRFPYVMEKKPYDGYEFNDISNSGTEVTDYFKNNSSREHYNVDLGFDFPYFGDSFKSLFITKRGALTLGEDGGFNSTSQFHGANMPDGYISALLKEWAVAKAGSIHYKRELGKFILQYKDVRHANDNENVAITFQIELYSNGDIKFIYDKFDGLYAYHLNSMYSAIENAEKTDGVLVNSSYDKVSLPMRPQQIVHIHSPGLGLIKEVAEPKGMIQPGESKELLVTLDGEKLIEGAHTEYISVLSNDPFNSSVAVEVNINVTGGGESELLLSDDKVEFGNVFQLATKKGILGAKNDGSKQIEITDISFKKGQLSFEGETSMIIEPNQTLFLEYILDTESLGTIDDTLVITDAEGNTYEIPFTGKIVDAPGIEVMETAYSETMEPGEKLVKSFKVTNTGKSTLEYAIAATEHVTLEDPTAAQDNVPEFTYVNRTTYDDNMKPDNQWIKLTEEDKVTFYLADNDNWEVIDLPFEFEFYQEKYDKLWMSTQGVLSFDEIEDESLSYFVPPSVPNDDELNNIISPYFAAGGPNTNLAEDKWGRYMKAFDDKVVFEWRGYNNLFFIGSEFSIQAILYKNGKIKFQYKSNPEQPIRAFYGLIGIENKEGTDGMQIAYYQDYVANGVAVEINPAKKETLAAGASKTYDLTINTEGVNAGMFEESLKVFNNTPLNPEIVVPIDLEVTGEAELTFNPEIIDLGEEMVTPGAAYISEFTFSNSGKRTMTVNNLRVEDATTAKIEHLTYNFRWGWRWAQVQPNDSFEVEPGFESKVFRLTVSPQTPDPAYTNKVFADTDFGTTAELPINAEFKLPPAFTVNNEEIYHIAFNDDVYSHTLNMGNLEGESPLSYVIGMNYFRENVFPASAPTNADTDATLLRSEADFTPNYSIVQSDVEFANLLSHDDADTPWTSVGFNGDVTFSSATRFVAPETGFNLSHVQTWYNYGSWLDSDLIVEIRVGDQLEDSDVLYKETLNYVAEAANEDGELITLALGETVDLQPYEKFFVVITYPLGANYPQGVIYTDEYSKNRYKFFNAGFWWDIAEGGLGTSGWMVRAGEVEASEKNWLSVNGTTSGDIEAGASMDLNVELHPSRASRANNFASLSIETNDPDMELVTIPVTLDINQAPDLVLEDMYYVNENETLNITLGTSDLEGDMVTGARMVENDPKTELSFDAGMVDFSFSPDYEDAGIHTFEVALEDENGIEGMSTIKVEVVDVNRNPEAALIGTQTLNLYTGEYRLNLEGIFTDPDGDAVSSLTPVANNDVVEIFVNDNSMLVSPSTLGTSTITLKGVDGRGGEITTTFDVVVVENVTKDSDLEESWKVHPNPVNETMYVKMYSPVMEKMNIRFYNTLGALVKTAQSEGSDSMIEVPVSSLSPGIYFVEITTENARSVKKIVKN